MSARDPRIVMEDELPGRRLGWVAGIGVTVILAGGAVSTAMARARPSPPPGNGQAPSAIGMVEQTQIAVQDRGLAVERRARASLELRGVVDGDAGATAPTAPNQIPIDEAVRQVIAAYADAGAGTMTDGETR